MAPQMDAKRQLEALLEHTAQVIPEDELLKKLERSLATGQPLRAKLGIDPSRPDLHLGHAVVLGKLREFQELGHVPVLIIGDYTGLVGDPSGQSETRPMLTPDEMKGNAQTYFEQAGLVLDLSRTEVRWNSEWLSTLTMADVIGLTSHVTVARMLERDDFAIRYREERPISVVEFLYPLMQAYDSVAIRADVELGGTDQTFNLLMGRDIQRAYGQEPQVVFTMPLLEGTDGVRKMSKSFDNSVGLTDPPEEKFGKLMSVPDGLIGRYLRMAARRPSAEAEAVERDLAEGGRHPNEAKRAMARAVVALYHGEDAAREAEERFDLVFKKHEVPTDVQEIPLPAGAVRDGLVWLPRLLTELGLAGSNGEGRRLIEQGGVRLDGQPVTDPDAEMAPAAVAGSVIQVGRRRFVRIAAG